MITLNPKELVVYDLETYPNYFLAAFKGLESGKIIRIEVRGRDERLDEKQKRLLLTLLCKKETFGFNSRNFDDPISAGAIAGLKVYDLYLMCNEIISQNKPGWLMIKERELGHITNRFNTFDIAEPAPAVRISLKLYGARMHFHKLQDIPVTPGKEITTEEMDITRDYCGNDLDTTIALYYAILPMLELRREMSQIYGQEFMSKGDAQIAEMIIKHELKIKYAKKKRPPAFVRYKAPSFVRFKSKPLNDILDKLERQEFTINPNGNPVLPTWLSKDGIKIGNMTHGLGLGGLHSKEKDQVLESSETVDIIDADVVSYYPFIMLNSGIEPVPGFLDVFRELVDRRLDAKARGDKIATQSLKICINGTFGKLGSSYSFLYDPELMLATTLTGQLALLMLIESLETKGFRVMSSNTDGVVSIVPKGLNADYRKVCTIWERETGFELEFNKYSKLVSNNVNNYFAITEDNEVKTKGHFAETGLRKNPNCSIVYKAVIAYFKDAIPIHQTITECRDLTEFLIVRGVTGGGYWKLDRNNNLGKVVRFYYGEGGDTIHYNKNDNKVPLSDCAIPVMDLPTEFPSNILYEMYIEKAQKLISKL